MNPFNKKPVIVLDFDGVCHSYTSPWQGPEVIPDPPVPGVFDFIVEASEEYQIAIFSSRSVSEEGRDAMIAWMRYHFDRWFQEHYIDDLESNMCFRLQLWYPSFKPTAVMTIDDRAFRFEGIWPTIQEIKQFKPWNKREGN